MPTDSFKCPFGHGPWCIRDASKATYVDRSVSKCRAQAARRKGACWRPITINLTRIARTLKSLPVCHPLPLAKSTFCLFPLEYVDMVPYKPIAEDTLRRNSEYQYALKVHSEKLEAELAVVDQLLVSVFVSYRSQILMLLKENADIDEEDSPLTFSGSLHIEGAQKASGLLSNAELLLEVSAE